jgi:hypothetical protein
MVIPCLKDKQTAATTTKTSALFTYLFIFAVLGLELRAYNLSHSTSPFLEKGSCELFALAGFELQSF